MGYIRLKIMLLAVLWAVLPSSGVTQTPDEPTLQRFTSGGQRELLARQTLLDSHPRCSEAGQVPFSVVLESDRLDLEFEGDAWDGSVLQFSRRNLSANAGVCVFGRPGQFRRWSDRQQCNSTSESDQVVLFGERACPDVISRHGNQVGDLEARCLADENPPSLNDLIKAAEVELTVSVTALVCQATTGIGIIQGTWLAKLKMGDVTTSLEGELGAYPEDDNLPKVTLRYRQGGLSLATIPDYANGDVGHNPLEFGNYMLELDFDGLQIPTVDAPPLSLEARARFEARLE